MTRVPIGCGSIDRILGGGMESSAITQLYGEGGSGKTNVCLQVTRNVVKAGQKVIYIDTEGVSMERFMQICGGDEYYRDLSREILFFQPMSSSQLHDAVLNTVKLASRDLHIGLVVLDSATVFYRMNLGSNKDEENRRDIGNVILELMGISRKQDIPVIITTQVYQNMGPGDIRPIGGHSLAHNCKVIMKLEKLGEGGYRKATVTKHRSMPTGEAVLFKLTGDGVEDLDEEETELLRFREQHQVRV
ncbi:MAG: DNA repair and recombination protein RadB [Candidatus Thermoplasmatota archaeon]|nr:DNA repair and recombination protein RadB [Candidatus Thermoplasmatota archaeon]